MTREDGEAIDDGLEDGIYTQEKQSLAQRKNCSGDSGPLTDRINSGM
jgi:hypothetical protein